MSKLPARGSPLQRTMIVTGSMIVLGVGGCAGERGGDARPDLVGLDRAAVDEKMGRPCRTARRLRDGEPLLELGYYCVEGRPSLHLLLVDDEVVRVVETR